jgi:hypothetical protein
MIDFILVFYFTFVAAVLDARLINSGMTLFYFITSPKPLRHSRMLLAESSIELILAIIDFILVFYFTFVAAVLDARQKISGMTLFYFITSPKPLRHSRMLLAGIQP